jgi:hypothetical protein
VGGGTNISSTGGNIVDPSTVYQIPATTAFVSGTITNVLTGTATSVTLLKGATYNIEAPYSISLSAGTIAAGTSAVFGVRASFVTPGAGTVYLANQFIPVLPIPATTATATAGTASLVANTYTGIYTTSFTVPSTWGPAAGAAGYNPLTVTVVANFGFTQVTGNAMTSNAVTSFGVPSAANQPIVYVRVK